MAPITGKDAIKQYRMVSSRVREAGFDYMGLLAVGWRDMHHVTVIVFDQTKPEERRKVDELFKTLVREAAAEVRRVPHAHRVHGPDRGHVQLERQRAAEDEPDDQGCAGSEGDPRAGEERDLAPASARGRAGGMKARALALVLLRCCSAPRVLGPKTSARRPSRGIAPPATATGLEAVGTQQLARTRGKNKALLVGRKDLPAEYVRVHRAQRTQGNAIVHARCATGLSSKPSPLRHALTEHASRRIFPEADFRNAVDESDLRARRL